MFEWEKELVNHLLQIIGSVVVNVNKEDYYRWKGTSNCSFSVKSLCDLSQDNQGKQKDFIEYFCSIEGADILLASLQGKNCS